MEHQRKEEGGKWVSLVEPCQAPDVGAAEDKVGGVAVGSDDPWQQLREVLLNLFQCCGPVSNIEGVDQICS